MGRLASGLPGTAWDVIMIEGAVAAIPPALAAQVAPGGRLVTVVHARPARPAARRCWRKRRGSRAALRSRSMFDCSTALLPSLRPAPAFVF